MANNSERSATNTELGSVNLVQLVLRNKKTYLFIAILSVVGSAVVSLILPEKYKSTTSLFPTRSRESIGQNLTNELLSNTVHLLPYGAKIDGERYLQIINSATVRDLVIEANGLYEHYEIDPDGPKAKAYIYDEYSSNVSANMTRYESIEIEVLDKDPQKAADIANSITAFSDSLELQIRLERSRNSFETAKEEYDRLSSQIATYEDSIAFIRSKGLIDFYTQVPELTREYGDALGKGFNDRANRIKAALDTIGKYGNDYIRQAKRMEEIREIQDLVYNRMELFRLDQGDRLSSMFVIDKAQVADDKSYPVRWLIVVLTTGAVLFLLTMTLLILENFKSKEA
jgi:uncharacterized protein involved in exopolysaccharide biosynthesis